MAEYTLAEAAFADLKAIYKEGYAEFGEAQADKYQQSLHKLFELLASFSGMGLAVDLQGHDFFRFPHAGHIIIYSKNPDGIRVEFVVKGCTDWLSHIRHWSKP